MSWVTGDSEKDEKEYRESLQWWLKEMDLRVGEEESMKEGASYVTRPNIPDVFLEAFEVNDD